MIIRAIDNTNDWLFGHGLTDYAQNEAGVEENIKTRLQSWVGDCFFALQDGIDWRSRLDFGQKQNLLNELKTEILSSFGVVAVLSITGVFDGVSRTFTVNATIQTIFSAAFQIQLSQQAGAITT